MTRKFILGTIAIFFAKLHYRYEVWPYADSHRVDRDHVRSTSLIAHGKLFDESWPLDQDNS